MSRSYKRFPGCSSEFQSKKYGKKLAARKVRHYLCFDEVSDGGWYKRIVSRNVDVKPFFVDRFYSDKETWQYVEKKVERESLKKTKKISSDDKLRYYYYYMFKAK
jgi:hypothetical protein